MGIKKTFINSGNLKNTGIQEKAKLKKLRLEGNIQEY